MARAPDVAPVLSQGKHRNPRKGACFMEYASWLAGERWSDHPKCTHPLLASLARHVNDFTSDDARSSLVGLVPSVVGLNSDDPRLDVTIAMRSAVVALPVVAEYRQRALAVSLLTAQRVLADIDQGSIPAEDTELLSHAQEALEKTPLALRWAKQFVTDDVISPKEFQGRAAPAAVRIAVVGIAEAVIPDPDSLLYELISTVIRDCNDRGEITFCEDLLRATRNKPAQNGVDPTPVTTH